MIQIVKEFKGRHSFFVLNDIHLICILINFDNGFLFIRCKSNFSSRLLIVVKAVFNAFIEHIMKY